MKFNLNRDFHEEIYYFASLLHQYKMMWGRILPPPDETGMTVDIQHPFETQASLPILFALLLWLFPALLLFISCLPGLISQSEDETISMKAMHNQSFGLLCGQTLSYSISSVFNEQFHNTDFIVVLKGRVWNPGWSLQYVVVTVVICRARGERPNVVFTNCKKQATDFMTTIDKNRDDFYWELNNVPIIWMCNVVK